MPPSDEEILVIRGIVAIVESGGSSAFDSNGEMIRGGVDIETAIALLGAFDAERARAERYAAALREIVPDTISGHTLGGAGARASLVGIRDIVEYALGPTDDTPPAAIPNSSRTAEGHAPEGPQRFVTLYEAGFRDAIEAAAKLCERERCRNWDSKECAEQIRDPQQIPIPTRGGEPTRTASDEQADVVTYLLGGVSHLEAYGQLLIQVRADAIGSGHHVGAAKKEETK